MNKRHHEVIGPDECDDYSDYAAHKADCAADARVSSFYPSGNEFPDDDSENYGYN